MTAPAPAPTQTNAKAWVATIGSLIISTLPVILQLLGHLPAPWGLVFTGIGVVLSAFTGKGTHYVSNAPTGHVLVPVPVDDTITNPNKP